MLFSAYPEVSPPRRVGKRGETAWRRPNYATTHRMIENPIYGGAYAYGKTGRTAISDAGLNGVRVP